MKMFAMDLIFHTIYATFTLNEPNGSNMKHFDYWRRFEIFHNTFC